MQRKDVLRTGASVLGALALSRTSAATGASAAGSGAPPLLGKPVRPPAHGIVQVAFVIGPETVMIDVAGPMAAFIDAMDEKMAPAFNTYTVAASTKLVDMGGLNVQPDHSFENAPAPHVLVVPQQKHLPETLAYIKAASARADVTMSVCNGAFLLADAGLLDGLYATAHRSAYAAFARKYPKVKLVRGARFVENRDISSSGGESCGIDLALRVVERYYGARRAADSALALEYVRTPRPA